MQNDTRAPVVWSDPLWALIEQLRSEAAAMRRVRPDHPDAQVAEAYADRIQEALAEGTGEVWVGTRTAVLLTRQKEDTIRSWHRRQRVRTRKAGGRILYHRDDLVGGVAR